MSDGHEEREEREKRLEQERRDQFRSREADRPFDRGFDPISDRIDSYPVDPWQPERRDS